MSRPLALSLLLTSLGTHVAAWRHPSAPLGGIADFAHFRGVAQAAEAAGYDLLFIADTLYVEREGRAIERRFPRHAHIQFDPMALLSALAVVTDRIGLAATISTTYSAPFHTARAVASLDHLSGGRAGWNVVTSQSNLEARNFGLDLHAEHGDRYARAADYVDVVTKLWDSWQADAIVADRTTGIATDPAGLHAVRHQGPHYRVDGPLVISRPPQGRPVVIQAGSSEAGQALAAATADIVFTAQERKEDARIFYAGMKRRLPAFGRAADALLVMPGVLAIVGETEAEAHRKFAALQDLVDPALGLALLGNILQTDELADIDVDKPLPPLADTNASKSRLEAIRRMGADEKMSVREIYMRLAPGRGHLTLVGAAEQVADTLAEWHRDDAADGFMLVPALMPQSQADFDALVLPILRDRGLLGDERPGHTLRERLGLPVPPSRF